VIRKCLIDRESICMAANHEFELQSAATPELVSEILTLVAVECDENEEHGGESPEG